MKSNPSIFKVLGEVLRILSTNLYMLRDQSTFLFFYITIDIFPFFVISFFISFFIKIFFFFSFFNFLRKFRIFNRVIRVLLLFFVYHLNVFFIQLWGKKVIFFCMFRFFFITRQKVRSTIKQARFILGGHCKNFFIIIFVIHLTSSHCI